MGGILSRGPKPPEETPEDKAERLRKQRLTHFGQPTTSLPQEQPAPSVPAAPQLPQEVPSVPEPPRVPS